MRTEWLEDRSLLSATVAGTVWNDANNNGVRDAGESVIKNWFVYADANANGHYDSGEVYTYTGADGSYKLTLPAGSYRIRQQTVPAWQATFPTSTWRDYVVTLKDGDALTGLDFGSLQRPTFAGTLWNDANGDGTRQTGEAALAGWTVYADTNNNSQFDSGEPSTVTAADGTYKLTVYAGKNIIRAVTPSALWKPTAPTSGNYTVTLSGGNIWTGEDFGFQQQATISGSVWNDANANGIRDTGETAIANWSVWADANGNNAWDSGEPFAYTAADGTYKITAKPGTYVIHQQTTLWVPTAPASGTYSVTVAGGDALTGKDFGDTPRATISGSVWNDANANGIRDAGETALANWCIYADANGNNRYDTGEPITSTAADGTYRLSVMPGSYVIHQQTNTTWAPTAPASATYSVTVTGGAVVTGKDFASVLSATISGSVWNDANANGIRNTGETALANWCVWADANGNNRYDSGEPITSTAADGTYKLSVKPGTYVIYQQTSTTWVPTAPAGNAYTVTVAAGAAVTGKDFASVQKATISGSVWNDANANGVRDAGETALANWGIWLDTNGNNAFDSGEPSTFTAADGTYKLTVMPGTYVIHQQQPTTGMAPTVPGSGTYLVTVAGGEVVTGKDFADAPMATISGSVWDDSNGNGQRDTGEGPLAKWAVYADANNNNRWDTGEPLVYTAADGTYTMSVAPGTYVIHQQTNTTWVATSPSDKVYSVTVKLGDAVMGKNFASMRKTTVSGTVWNDANNNGIRDAGETPLSNWFVYADANGNGCYDKGEVYTYSTADGTYTLSVLPGSYRIRQQTVPAWQATSPSGSRHEYAVTLLEGDAVTGKDFGSLLKPTISGVVWNDANGNGIRDAGEALLANWLVFADANNNGILDAGEASAYTAADGSYKLTVGPGTYTIREQSPNGWVPTAPTAGGYLLSVAANDALLGKDFGNRISGALSAKAVDKIDLGPLVQDLVPRLGLI